MNEMFQTVLPGIRRGQVRVPFSKSHLHRLLIAAFLAGARDFSEYEGISADVTATCRCLKALASEALGGITLDCGESGSTLRFMMPVAMALKNAVTFIASGRLPQRPVAPFLDLLEQHGVNVPSHTFPLMLQGKLCPGIYELPGNISSQIVTGLLFALPLLQDSSAIRLTTPLESAGYVDMTLDVIRSFGIRASKNAFGYDVPGNQRYHAPEAIIPERDWSGAAFWLVMNQLGSHVELLEMNDSSRQPDRAIGQLLRHLGETIDVAQCPDAFPALTIAAAAHNATTVFTGVQRLRMKESDRLAAMAAVLEQLGVNCTATEQTFTVHGTNGRFRGNVRIPTFGDHRIAMAAAVAATIADGPVQIQNPACVDKSYPGFFQQLDSLFA